MKNKKEILYAINQFLSAYKKSCTALPCDKIFPWRRAKVTFARPLFGIFYKTNKGRQTIITAAARIVHSLNPHIKCGTVTRHIYEIS